MQCQTQFSTLPLLVLVLAVTLDVTCSENPADAVWKEQYELIGSGFSSTSSLLKLYDCPLYSDQQGIIVEEPSTPGSTVSPPYSTIPTDTEPWTLFEEAYYFAIDVEAPAPKQNQLSNEPILRGMRIPYEVKYSGNFSVGRAIYATSFVPKGTIIWDARRMAAFTQDRSNPESSNHDDDDDYYGDGVFKYSSYRRFLEYLYNYNPSLAKSEIRASNSIDSTNTSSSDATAPKWVCDAIMWGFMGTYCPADDSEDDEHRKPQMARCLGMDHGSLFNDAKGNTAAANIVEYSDDDYELFGLVGHRKGKVAHPPSSSSPLDGMPKAKKIRLPEADCQRGTMFATRDIQPGEELRYEYGLTFENKDVTYHHEYQPCDGYVEVEDDDDHNKLNYDDDDDNKFEHDDEL